MPSKKKNAFFYFAIEFREEEKKKGIIYKNMDEVIKAASPAWEALDTVEREKYKPNAMTSRSNIPIQKKYNSFGVPFSELENQERLAKEAAEQELKYIRDFVFQNSMSREFLEKTMYIIDVNALCESNAGYVFGEFAIIRFNIKNGVIDHFNKIINPPTIPLGYASDIKLGCEALALELPDPDKPKTDFMKLMALIVTYLKESNPDSDVLPAMYTMPEKVDQVRNFIRQLCDVTLEREENFPVYKLDLLFFYVINTFKTHNNEGLPKASLALAALRKDPFKYSPGLGCEHHEAGERPTECCQARAIRWAYTILDSCCPVAGVEAVPGLHLPAGTDLEAVIAYKEKKKEASRYPQDRPLSSMSYASSVNESFETQSATSSVARKPQRVLKPLRKPTVETLQFQSTVGVAPELSKSNFPPLSAGPGVRRGSGRNLNTRMQNLDLGK